MAALETILNYQATQYSIQEMVLGMAHRGRLCTLTNFLNQPKRQIIAQFKGIYPNDNADPSYSGDVKYHRGYESDRIIGDQTVHLTLLSNPSHLEAVNPVVLGNVRSRQRLLNDPNRSLVSGVMIHGDASFAGQGLVAETLELSALKGYQTGGTIHIIINNQIGFTTSPPMSRSSPYCSDLAKVIQAPVFHVNGDDPDAVVAVTKLAVDFKHRFQQDVVIDIVCYRRHGHNEGDEPMFTQPIMYQAIANQSSVAELYQRQFIEQGILNESDINAIAAAISDHLTTEFNVANENAHVTETVHKETIQQKDSDINAVIAHIQKAHTVPAGFHLHPKLIRLMEQRQKMLTGEIPFDWGMGEILAFSSLLSEGHHVRLSGQDSTRGTFSHRHAIWIDQENEQTYCPLQHLKPNQAVFEAVDSPLAEASVLGFEHGYSLNDPHSLVMWEAQFGDFANGAQVIIDQFIASSGAKWNQNSNLVMLLPHGYEGQGPEHSSARLERYLQLSANDNWRVMNCTTPANLFHTLRGQIYSPTKKTVGFNDAQIIAKA